MTLGGFNSPQEFKEAIEPWVEKYGWLMSHPQSFADNDYYHLENYLRHKRDTHPEYWAIWVEWKRLGYFDLERQWLLPSMKNQDPRVPTQPKKTQAPKKTKPIPSGSLF